MLNRHAFVNKNISKFMKISAFTNKEFNSRKEYKFRYLLLYSVIKSGAPNLIKLLNKDVFRLFNLPLK